MKMMRRLRLRHSAPSERQEPVRTVETDVEARQGPKGRPVLIVLTGSLLLLAVYLIGMLLWSGATTPSSPRDSTTATISRDSTADMNEISPANPAYPVPAVPAAK